MPYDNVESLPESIKKTLPIHAQEIYLKAFNHALEEYKDPQRKRDEKEDVEVVAYKVAWAAVKKKYKKDKNSDGWIEK